VPVVLPRTVLCAFASASHHKIFEMATHPEYPMPKSLIGGVRLYLYQPWMLPRPMDLPVLLMPLQHLEVFSKDRISKSPLIHHFTPLMINGRIPHRTHSSCEDLEMGALELSNYMKTWPRIRQLTRLRWTYSSRMIMQSALPSTHMTVLPGTGWIVEL